ncbi:hypothetical protein [Methylobacterium oryzisoli]|uniref:hypothetical protein n=1 Tax=Methylobacterium oryzisoli TaxID=3385502 RepID=UPI003892702A
MSDETLPEGAIAAAFAEHDRWSTALNTRRPRATMAWVCRRDDNGEWIETSAHPSDSAAAEAMHKQALRAAVMAALTPDQGAGR